MSDNIIKLTNCTKEEQYASLLAQLKSLLDGETDMIASMSNMSAAIMQVFDFLWVGFYLVRQDSLVLGPFQGTVACMRIAWGRGVCGTAWKQKQTLIVSDVDLFPGHIACSSISRSEIVIPLFSGNTVVAVLDIDSESTAAFEEVDARFLEQFVKLIPIF
jgi:GAF domain-containing protein